jgi:crotonobetainyl-CoA:carnitine CoA-transferase CaiB-like acyl-CoA transferase
MFHQVDDRQPSALDGVRIIDFSRILAGPLATMVLADLGAEVVKVERPGTGDDTRSWGPPTDDRGVATYFSAVNRGKTSVTLDLATEAGAAAARQLVAGADVVVENFRPGVMDRMGLGGAELCRADPSLIYCSISAFGAGRGAALPGFDLIVQAVGGLMSITGAPDGPPQTVGVALVDVVTGLYASVGILAALRHREQTGEGQRVEVDLLSCLLAALANQSTAFTAAGVVAQPMGNEHPSIAPYELLATADGQLAVAVGNQRQFAALCSILGAPGLVEEERFATNTARVANRSALRRCLEDRLAGDTTARWAEALSAGGVPAGPVNDIAGAFGLAEQLGLDPTVIMTRADGSPIRLPRNPIRLSRTPVTYRRPPPPLG